MSTRIHDFGTLSSHENPGRFPTSNHLIDIQIGHRSACIYDARQQNARSRTVAPASPAGPHCGITQIADPSFDPELHRPHRPVLIAGDESHGGSPKLPELHRPHRPVLIAGRPPPRPAVPRRPGCTGLTGRSSLRDRLVVWSLVHQAAAGLSGRFSLGDPRRGRRRILGRAAPASLAGRRCGRDNHDGIEIPFVSLGRTAAVSEGMNREQRVAESRLQPYIAGLIQVAAPAASSQVRRHRLLLRASSAPGIAATRCGFWFS